MTGTPPHDQETIERWLADRHHDIRDGLSRFLDPDAGLRDAMLRAEHADLAGALDGRLDTEAGLAAILPPPAAAAPQFLPGPAQRNIGPEQHQRGQMRQRPRRRIRRGRLDAAIDQILDSDAAAAALAPGSLRSGPAEAGLAADPVGDARIAAIDALLARAIMLGGSQEQAERAVAAAYREIDQEEGEQAREPWGWTVTVMTRQLAIIVQRDNYARYGMRQHILEIPVPPGLTPEERAEVATVMRALYDLFPREREVAVLYYLCGQAPEQIAEILGIGRDRAGKDLRAAARKLARKLRMTAPPARPGGPPAAPAPGGATAAMAGQVGARLAAVTAWLTEGSRADAHVRERIRQRIGTRPANPGKGELQ